MAVTRHTPFDELPQFLSPKEFLALVPIGRSTLYDLLRREEISCAQFGRRVFIPRESLRRYMAGNGEKHDDPKK